MQSNYVERAVGTSSGLLLPPDPFRRSFTLANGTANMLYIAFAGGAASATSIPITPNGGQYTFDYEHFGDMVASQINAIFATAGATIGVLVGLRTEHFSVTDGS